MNKEKVFNYTYLKHLITINGISLTTLEKYTGVSHSTLSLLTRGISISPQHETVKALAVYFKVSVHDFYNKSTFNPNKHPSLLLKVLKNLMKKSGIVSSSELHRQTGLSIPTIDRIINGITTSPNEQTLTKLAQFFKISIAQLKGIEPIVEIESLDKKTTFAIPLIDIHNVFEWLKKKDLKFIIKYIESSVINMDNDHYAMIYNTTTKIITYIFNSQKYPQKGDVILLQNQTPEVLIYLNATQFLTLDYVNIDIKSKYIILGVSIQEIHNAI